MNQAIWQVTNHTHDTSCGLFTNSKLAFDSIKLSYSAIPEARFSYQYNGPEHSRVIVMLADRNEEFTIDCLPVFDEVTHL